MNSTTKLREIFTDSFDESEEWVSWFFNTVASDSRLPLLVHDASGRPVSGLLIQPYKFIYQGRNLTSGYISCVATRRNYRGKGYASELMRHSIGEARQRGMALLELIPANDSLCFFYGRFGFTTVFYHVQDRYTAVHTFGNGSGELVEADYELLHRLETSNGCGVIHSAADFENIRTAFSYEPGHQIIAAKDADGSAAILFATYNSADKSSDILVRSLMADNKNIALTVMGELRRRVPEYSICVRRPPYNLGHSTLHPSGMIRIADAETVLAALARKHSGLKMTIRVHDPLVEANNGVFELAGGQAQRYSGGGHTDLDVDIRVLATILFSPENAGKIFSLPTHRPYMALMLE